MYIYCADVYCDDCGQDICRRLEEEGKRPDSDCPDTDGWPQSAPDGEPCDCPQHCGSGADCLNAEPAVWSNGTRLKVGCELDYSLTDEGIRYVVEHIREALTAGEWSTVLDCWAARVDSYDLDDPQRAWIVAYIDWRSNM